MKKFLFFVLGISMMLTACDSSQEDACIPTPDTGDLHVALSYQSLADSFVHVSSKAALVELLTRHEVMRDYFFQRPQYPNDSVFVNDLYARLTNPHMDTLLQEVHRVFGDEAALKQQFTEAFRNLLYYYPDATVPTVVTTLSGLQTDLFVSDTLIIVGLDYFLGPGAHYRPKMYEYLLRQYEPANIVPSCMMIYGIGPQYNQSDLTDKTVLADMIAYGKSYYFAKHMLPCTPDSVFMWYAPEEIKGARDNADLIWYRFIEDQVLYSTSHVVKQRFLGERPKTLEVGEKCPGRIGQWVGWEIVKKYMEKHPEVTLPQLMNMPQADRIFKESGYRPGKK